MTATARGLELIAVTAPSSPDALPQLVDGLYRDSARRCFRALTDGSGQRTLISMRKTEYTDMIDAGAALPIATPVPAIEGGEVLLRDVVGPLFWYGSPARIDEIRRKLAISHLERALGATSVPTEAASEAWLAARLVPDDAAVRAIFARCALLADWPAAESDLREAVERLGNEWRSDALARWDKFLIDQIGAFVEAVALAVAMAVPEESTCSPVPPAAVLSAAPLDSAHRPGRCRRQHVGSGSSARGDGL